MTIQSRSRLRASVTVLLVLAQACSETECIIPPCAPPFAIEVTVTSAATGAAVPGVSIALTRGVSGGGPCPDSRCAVFGNAGSYEFDISAPGYQTVHRSVVVSGTNPECGCPTVETQRLTVALPLAAE